MGSWRCPADDALKSAQPVLPRAEKLLSVGLHVLCKMEIGAWTCQEELGAGAAAVVVEPLRAGGTIRAPEKQVLSGGS